MSRPVRTPDRPGLFRRRDVLVALGGVGAIGTAAGAGTAARYYDQESLNSSLTGGRLDLRLVASGDARPANQPPHPENIKGFSDVESAKVTIVVEDDIEPVPENEPRRVQNTDDEGEGEDEDEQPVVQNAGSTTGDEGEGDDGNDTDDGDEDESTESVTAGTDAPSMAQPKAKVDLGEQNETDVQDESDDEGELAITVVNGVDEYDGVATFCLKVKHNPGIVWLHTDCPEKCDVARAVDVHLWLDGDGDRRVFNESTLFDGTLCEFQKWASNGIVIDPVPNTDRVDPFPVDEYVCLKFAWTVGEESECEGETVVQFDFLAQQARHLTPVVSPWPNNCDVDCDAECESCDGPEDSKQHGISFVAFCVGDSEVEADDIEITDVDFNDDDEPISVTWESDVEVETVVLKYATYFENFHVSATSGTATVGSGDEVYSSSQTSQTPSNPCPGGGNFVKFEVKDDDFEPESEENALPGSAD